MTLQAAVEFDNPARSDSLGDYPPRWTNRKALALLHETHADASPWAARSASAWRTHCFR